MSEAMLLTTGEQIVYIVFYSDLECQNFVGVFATQAAAENIAQTISLGMQDFYKKSYQHEWGGSVEVCAKVLGSFDLPLDLSLEAERNP